jgi:aspartyl-tRNA(Asn)/glutamyl-tRNA(Gln) amidotransferase subunit B
MASSIRDKYTLVIGLEVHAQLLTNTKIYNTDSNAFGSEPNTNIGVITLAHPGTLPLLNKKVVEYAIKMGLACSCEISRFQIFDRKNYFYPDLPKGYQLTQDRTPICVGGHVTIDVKAGQRNVKLNRIHIEEDAGKSIHTEDAHDTLLDFNRAGVPLIEIVTEPDMHSSDEAAAILTEIRKLVRYLDICDGNMEEGSLRCDANISVMPKGSTTLGKKVEVKNMNSIRNVQRAIEHEFDRQIGLLEKGEPVISETRTFNADNGKTYGMRTKEELNDYRYFPDPDLSPMIVSEEWLERIRATMPVLPRDRAKQYVEEYGLPMYDALILTDTKEMAAYFDGLVQHTKNYKAASNWMMGSIKSYLNETGKTITEFPLKPTVIAEIIGLVDANQVSNSIATQRIFPALLENPTKSALTIAKELNVIQESNVDSLIPIIDEVIKEFPLKVEEYQKGKKGIISMFMGEVMKRSKGKADPKVATELLAQKLKKA